MTWEIISHYAFKFWAWKDIKILMDFRSEREIHVNDHVECLEVSQYQWGAKKSQVNETKVRKIVCEWMENKPLNSLAKFRFPDLLPFMNWLLKNKIEIAYFSDYPTKKKLAALEVPSGLTVCATDAEVNKLKPDPQGLKIITQKLNLDPGDCLMIGNRDDRDGEAARRIGMPYLILEKTKTMSEKKIKNFKELYVSI